MKNNFELRKILLYLGITSNMQAYQYILETVEMLKKQQIHTNITFIYKCIADKYLTSKYAVERTIRYAVKKSYDNKNILKRIYDTVPDNAVFLYDLYFNIDIIKQVIKELKNDK